MGIPFGVSLFLWGAGLRTLRVGSSEAALGAQRPGGPADSGGGARLSLEESRRKEHQGGRGSSSLDPSFLVGGTLRGSSLFSAWPAALYLTPVTARPPAGRAGGGGFADGKSSSHPQSLPLGGEGGPAKPGRMRGRPIGPTEREKEVVEATGPSFYKERLGTESPPHQSPSVTASPQGEAFVGATPLQQNAFSPTPCSRKMRIQIRARRWASKQPHHRNNAPQPPKRASGNERAIKPGVQGACPWPSFSPFLGGELQ